MRRMHVLRTCLHYLHVSASPAGELTVLSVDTRRACFQRSWVRRPLQVWHALHFSLGSGARGSRRGLLLLVAPGP